MEHRYRRNIGNWLASILVLLLQCCFLTTTYAQSFTLDFETEPPEGNGATATKTYTVHGVEFRIEFTADGDGGDIVRLNDGFGPSVAHYLDLGSLIPNLSTTERVTIRRVDGGVFIIQSLKMRNNGEDDITIQGYRSGNPVGASHTLPNNDIPLTFTFGSGEAVDEVRLTSGSFYQVGLDDIVGELASIATIQNRSQAENVSPMAFTVSLSATHSGIVSMNYATQNGTAIAGTDYVATNGTLTFDPGVTEQVINVPITNNTLYELNKTFSVVLSNPVNAILGNTTATGTIQNDDPAPAVSLSADESEIEENGGVVTITATLNTVSGVDATIDLGFAGSAVSGTDYSITSGANPITIPAGQTTGSVMLTATDNLVATGDKTIVVTFASLDHAEEADPPQTLTITIEDDDWVPIIDPDQVFGVIEGSSAGTIVGVVQADHKAGTTLQSWTITTNYNPNGNGTNAFAIDAVTGQITVNDPDDLDYEDDPQATIEVTVSDGANTSAPQSVTINILPQPPVVVAVRAVSDDGLYKIDDQIEIEVEFDHPVEVSGTPRILLETGDTDQWAIFSGQPTSQTMVFTYTVLEGDFTLDLDYVDENAFHLNGGSIRRQGAIVDADIELPVPGQPNSLGANANIVVDGVRPTVSTQNLIVNLDTDGTATITIADIDDGSFDNLTPVDDLHMDLDQYNFNCSHIGENTVTLTVTDAVGNSAQATAIVTIADNLPPVLDAVTVYEVFLDANGEASITFADVVSNVTDNCGIDEQTLSRYDFNCDDVGGPIEVTVRATDVHGNENTTIVMVTVTDNIPPTVSTRNITVRLGNDGTAAIIPGDIDDGSTDNCGIANISLDINMFSCGDVGSPVTIELTVEDASGNSASETAVVTVVDNISPTIVAPTSLDVREDEPASLAAISFADADADLAKSWMRAVFEVTSGSLQAMAGGGVSVTGAGTGVLTLEGNMDAINAFIQNDQLTFTTNENATADGMLTVTTYSAACNALTDMVSITLEVEAVNDAPVIHLPPSPQQTGINQNLRLSSASGNRISVEDVDVGIGVLTVTVSVTHGYIHLPNASESGVTILGDATPIGQSTLAFEGSLLQVNEALDEMIYTPLLNFVGLVPFTVSVNDNGHTGSGGAMETEESFIIQVGDQQPIVNRVHTDEDDSAYGIGEAITLHVVFEQEVFVSGGEPRLVMETGVGDRYALYTGKTEANILSFVYTVQEGDESMALEYVSANALEANGATLLNLLDEPFDLTLPTPGSANALSGATTLVIDGIRPTVVTQDLTVTLDGNGMATLTAIDIDDGSSDNITAMEDLIFALDRTDLDCADLGEQQIMLTVTDAVGNEATATTTVTVVDNTVPVALAQDITISLDINGEATITAADIDNGSTDNCEITMLLIDRTTFTCADLGEQVVTLTVADASGNEATATATVTVVDETAPTVLTRNLIVALDAGGQATITPEMVDNGSDDACGIATLVLSKTTFNSDDLGINTITLSATDHNGNESDPIMATVVVVAFENHRFVYDGTAKSLAISGDLPDGVEVAYTGNGQTEVGVYTVTATINGGNNYEDLVLTAELEITKASLVGIITFDDGNFVYDGTAKSIAISGDLPKGTEVTYTGNGQTEADIYTVRATISGGNNYEDLVLTATLEITAVSEISITFPSGSFVYDGTSKSLSIVGMLPEGVTVTYTNNGRVNVGVQTVTATVNGGGNYQDLVLTATLQVTSAMRTLSFPVFPERTYGDMDFGPGATASSGEIVSYASDNVSVAEIVDGLIRITGAGSTTITATIPENSNYSNRPQISQTLVVHKAAQTISFAEVGEVGRDAGSVQLDVSANSGLPISLEVSDEQVATLDGTVLNIHRLGTVLITATQEGDSNHEAAEPVTITVRVVDPSSSFPVRVHQAVSPNGDGINEFLMIEGIRDYRENRVQIFNRNGTIVWEASGYDNDRIAFRGIGTGQLRLPAGTYFYIVEVKNTNGRWEYHKGYFVLRY